MIRSSVGGRPTSVGKGRLLGRRILEVPVRVIFDDHNVELDTKGVNVFAALDTEGSGSRVLADSTLMVSSISNQRLHLASLRDGIYHVRSFSLALVPIFEDVRQSTFTVGYHSLVINCDGNDV